ncbi:hypothetical protein JCM10449v2_007715 [Rhodotorula kratochvilovae]
MAPSTLSPSSASITAPQARPPARLLIALADPVSRDAQPPRTRTQRALSRLSRFRLSSIARAPTPTPVSATASPAVAPRTAPEARPLKQLRRQSRSFSTFFSGPAGGASYVPAPALAPLSLSVVGERDADAPPALAKRATLKRTISYPVLQSASSPVDAPGADWWGVREATVRLELAQGEATFSPSTVAFPRLPATPCTPLAAARKWAESDESLVLDTPTWSIHLDGAGGAPIIETSRFSSSTEDMTVSSCASSAAGRCAVLDVFDAPPPAARESAGSPLDLDFPLGHVVPLSPPPSPEMYRHQPFVAHTHALAAADDAAMRSPTPARSRAQRWSLASSASSGGSSAKDVVDPHILRGFSYAATPAAPAASSAKSVLTPPPTPRIVPAAAEAPSPFLLPRALGTGGQGNSLLSLALEELTSEMDRFDPVQLPCGCVLSPPPLATQNLTPPPRSHHSYPLPSPPRSPLSLHRPRPVPFPRLSASPPPSAPLPPLPPRPDTPTPTSAPSFPFLCPSPPLARVRSRQTSRAARPVPAPIYTSNASDSSDSEASRTPLASPSPLSPFSLVTAASFPSPPTSPASSRFQYDGPADKASRRRPVLVTPLSPSPRSPASV